MLVAETVAKLAGPPLAELKAVASVTCFRSPGGTRRWSAALSDQTPAGLFRIRAPVTLRTHLRAPQIDSIRASFFLGGSEGCAQGPQPANMSVSIAGCNLASPDG